jgi:hypothetical protein
MGHIKRRVILKPRSKFLLVAILITMGSLAAQSCNLFGKSEFTNLEASDLSTMIDTLPDRQKRMMAENQGQRKELVKQLKQAFSLAQAAEDEGLHKSDKFLKQGALNEAQLLAAEYTKRNPDVNISVKELDSYYVAHKEAFQADLALINEVGLRKARVSRRSPTRLTRTGLGAAAATWTGSLRAGWTPTSRKRRSR